MAESPSPPARRPRSRVRLTGAERRLFLEALAQGWTVSRAARMTGVERRRFYDLQEQDEQFAQAWAEAYETGTDLLEDELRRRSVEGFVEETRDANGKLVRTVRRVHGTDLHFALGVRKPELRSSRVDARVDLKASIDSPQIQEAIAAFTSRIAALAAAASAGALEPIDAKAVEE